MPKLAQEWDVAGWGMFRFLIAGSLLAGVAGVGSCSRPAATAATPGYDLSLDMKELMGHVVDPGAWAFWHASGEEITATGTKTLTPPKN